MRMEGVVDGSSSSSEMIDTPIEKSRSLSWNFLIIRLWLCDSIVVWFSLAMDFRPGRYICITRSIRLATSRPQSSATRLELVSSLAVDAYPRLLFPSRHNKFQIQDIEHSVHKNRSKQAGVCTAKSFKSGQNSKALKCAIRSLHVVESFHHFSFQMD